MWFSSKGKDTFSTINSRQLADPPYSKNTLRCPFVNTSFLIEPSVSRCRHGCASNSILSLIEAVYSKGHEGRQNPASRHAWAESGFTGQKTTTKTRPVSHHNPAVENRLVRNMQRTSYRRHCPPKLPKSNARKRTAICELHVAERHVWHIRVLDPKNSWISVFCCTFVQKYRNFKIK